MPDPLMTELIADLDAETDAVLRLVETLDGDGWQKPTPSEPWDVQDQIGHLAYFDEQAALAATDPGTFAELLNRDVGAVSDDIAMLHRRRGLDGTATLAWWVEARAELLEAFAPLDPDVRLPWYGPPMRARSALVARLMETWAHGTDVADALVGTLPVTDRLFHIADLGVRTFSWSFSNRNLDVPSERVRVALRGPSGATRVWNDAADASVTGPVDEFCLVVAQRRNIADTHLVIEGELAQRWINIAQVFAGPPGLGRGG